MKLWDVNIWVYAFRADSPRHDRSVDALKDSFESAESFLFSPVVASSFLRIVTNSRIFRNPSPLEEAWAFVNFLEKRPLSTHITADSETFSIFRHLSFAARASGNRVPDAFLASLAIRYNAQLVTADNGFTAYPGVNVELLAQ